MATLKVLVGLTLIAVTTHGGAVPKSTGLKATDSPSCQDRCLDNYDPNNFCQCNYQCGIYGNCCDDFIPLCASQDSCLNRCWAARNESNTCHCDGDCVDNGTCCSDHQAVCIDSRKSDNGTTAVTTCEGRCDSSYNPNDECQCNEQCRKYGNCCEDYVTHCLSPDSCNARCDEQHDGFGNCYCDSSCASFGNCCDDFDSVCNLISTCENRCNEEDSPSEATCYCDSSCTTYGNCCDDFVELCDKDEKYLCKGECNVTRSRCDCTTACVDAGNCCADYQETCLNLPPWVDEPCTPESEMQCPEGFDFPPLLLFSIDGFKAEYLYREFSPNIHKLASCGVHAPYMRSVYPTKTFPNHYSIATGLYPESHGIIDNTMYDHELQEEFRLGSPESFNPAWWGGEPIWVTASNQGLKSATYFWPGSDVNITRYPDYYYKYDGSVDNEERIYQAFDWLDMPKDQRPTFITLYMDIVDHAGHSYGPDAQETNQAIAEADDIIGLLMNGLKLRGLDKCVNLIVLADHGMMQLSCDRKASIEDYGVDASEVYMRGGAFGRVGKSKDESQWPLYDATEVQNKLRCTHEKTHWLSYLKYEYLPKRFHYANNRRIEDVLLTMDDGWLCEGYKGSYTSCSGGTHGFDNEYKSMHSLFAAHGPGFKRAFNTTEPFENIEVYNLMTDLMNIPPAPNNGTQGRLNYVMTNPNDLPDTPAGESPTSCTGGDDVAGEYGCPTCEGVDSTDADKRLNLNQDETQSSRAKQMLYGVPRVFPAGKAELTDDMAFCELTQQNYVTAYDRLKKMPFFVSYTLTDKSKHDLDFSPYCSRHDKRVGIKFTTTCSDISYSTISNKYLYPPGLSSGLEKNDAMISSNQVPMYRYAAKIWDYMTSSQSNWTVKYGGVNVVSGPVFDYDFDGLADTAEILQTKGKFVDESEKKTPIPTHFFMITTRCREVGLNIESCSSSPDDVEVLTFIIPNYEIEPCHNLDAKDKDWIPGTLLEHVARIKDVELLTGISFMSKWISSNQGMRVDDVRTKTWLPSFTADWLNDFMAGDLYEGVNNANAISTSKGLSFVVFLWYLSL